MIYCDPLVTHRSYLRDGVIKALFAFFTYFTFTFYGLCCSFPENVLADFDILAYR